LRKRAIYGRVFLMDAEDKKNIAEILRLSQENNAYLKKVRSSQKTAQIFKTIYWIFILCVMFGGLYFAKPYLNVLSMYSEGINGLKGAASINLLNQGK